MFLYRNDVPQFINENGIFQSIKLHRGGTTFCLRHRNPGGTGALTQDFAINKEVACIFLESAPVFLRKSVLEVRAPKFEMLPTFLDRRSRDYDARRLCIVELCA